MNRLVIIGNGFDLAHGLKTSYTDFIRNYWENVKRPNHKDELTQLSLDLGFDWGKFNSFKGLIEQIRPNRNDFYIEGHYASSLGSLQFENKLFHKLCKINDEVNWVDIEVFYYNELKDLFLKSLNATTSKSGNLKKIKELNNNLSRIINRFNRYLEESVVPLIKSKINPELVVLLENSINQTSYETFIREFAAKYENRLAIQYYTNAGWHADKTIKRYGNTQILNFNYTNTIFNYLNFSTDDIELVNIHGQVGNREHPINMGFGDEVDKFYKDIENSGEDEYLRFVKSFYYSNNSHYKRLLDFIEKDDFQCHIMGHSCGLSDRTLLKTIFEHPKCLSIKPYYYVYKQENEWHEKDNYLEIVKNISRHFDDKKMMRERVVNKEYCQPLPQI
ncbi:MAG: hypothetical protein EAY81_04085 [Bacteroidetes bacterium]|nr:MAG: hypothetical protein EAY81_04085 [Bacteroidota bacterium]